MILLALITLLIILTVLPVSLNPQPLLVPLKVNTRSSSRRGSP